MIKGIVTGLSESKQPFAKCVAAYRDLGVGHLRIWWDINWAAKLKASNFDDVRKYRDAGFPCCVCFTTKTPPKNAGVALDYFKAARAAAAGCVDIWEIGNEPNLTNYWEKADLAKFVDLIGIPGGTALMGEVTCSASISKDLKALQELHELGLFELYTYVGYHPYGYTPDEHRKNVTGACAIAAPKQLLLTEWNMHGATPSGWAKNIKDLWAFIKTQPLVAGAWYYRFIKSGQPAGKAGVVDSSIKPAQPFYDAVKSCK